MNLWRQTMLRSTLLRPAAVPVSPAFDGPGQVAWPDYRILCLPALMLCGWFILLVGGNGYLDLLGNPVGGDFAMFRLAAEMAASGQWQQLYDEPEQQRRLVEMFPGLAADSYLPYRYPPTMAILLRPLAALPYALAFVGFTLLGLSVWGLGWICLSNTCRFASSAERTAFTRLIVPMMAAPIAIQTLMDGQASMFWFGVAAGSWCLMERQRYFAAGSLLALAACKPNVMLLLAIVWLIRYPRLLLGLIPTGLLMLLITVATAGWPCLQQYVELARQLAANPWQVETPYWKVQSLVSWSELCLGDRARQFNLLVGIALSVAIAGWWRTSSRVLETRHIDVRRARSWLDTQALILALLVNSLFNAYTPVYDLTLLSLAVFVWLRHCAQFGQLCDWVSQTRLRSVLLCLWVGPIVSQSLSKAIGSPLQLMPIALVAIGLVIVRSNDHKLF